MKTGQSTHDTTLSDRITRTGTDLLNTLLEHAIVNACAYAKSAGRDNMSGKDIIIALQYEAHEFCNRSMNTADADTDTETSESEDDDDSDDPDEADDEFTPSYSDDPLIQRMNYYHETWESWIPELPLEKALKNAVDCAIVQGKYT